MAIREMDEMTQHNAALVEQTNAAIEQTETQAADLDRIVDVFVLAGQTRGSRATAARPAPAPTTAKAPPTVSSRPLHAHGNAALKQDWAEF